MHVAATDDPYTPYKLRPIAQPPIELHVNNVIDEETGESQSYEQLIKNPKTRATWIKSMCKELGRIAQGYKNLENGTNTVFFMTHNEIKNTPKDRTVTHTRIVADYRPQKEDPNRVRITVGGNLIKYPGEVTTRTADMATSKLLWNSAMSTPNARHAVSDIKNYYLNTPMDRHEHMRMPVKLIPEEFIQEYNLQDKIYNGYIYMEIRKGMYGLPQAGLLANRLLRIRLAQHGYYEVKHTRIMETQNTSNNVYTSSRRPRHKIRRKRTRRPFIECSQQILQNGNRLDRKPLLWNNVRMELR